MRICSVEECGKPHLAKGLCSGHYQHWRKTGEELGVRTNGRLALGYRKCRIDGCVGDARTKGLCPAHYQRLLKHGDPVVGATFRRRSWPIQCTITGCEGVTVATGLCHKHYARKARHGDPEGFSDWYKKRFEKIVDDHGYVTVYEPDHPNAGADGRVPEHRLVISKIVGRPLLPTETVHHRNGAKTDNDPLNLELWAKVHPPGQRVVDLVDWAKEILRLYPDELIAQLEPSRGAGS